jgi:16S rRNA U516 pseudouridylate synthase RsuA-like enzyme
MDSHMAEMRLNKIIADAGITSRRGADELIMAGQIFDHKARLRSFEIAAQAAREVHIPTALAA